jgi:hypothetical protein
VRVWDAESGGCLRELVRHAGAVRAVCALGGGRLASASWDKTVRVWDAGAGALVKVLEGHTSFVDAVRIVEGGRLMSVSSGDYGDGTLRLWDPVTLALLDTAPLGAPSAAQLAAPPAPGASPAGLGAAAHCGSTRFAPWGAVPVHLDAKVVCCELLSLPGGRRVAFVALANHQVHFLELVGEPR